MSHVSFFRSGSFRRLVLTSVLALVAVGILSPVVSAQQDVMTVEAAAEVKAAFIANLDVMRDKFIGLAEAFPEDKYTWRPMDGVRSVSEALMLIATEGYGYAPTALGAEAAKSSEETQELRMLTEKAQVIEHLNMGFDYAKAQLEAIDSATLTGRLGTRERTVSEAVGAVAGDMHEHLGQLIAYARMNQIVPPWSE
jgi:hypothetical protein